MKHIISTIYEGLINWSTIIAEYRQSPASKYHYWK
jgi:hypothetical protein